MRRPPTMDASADALPLPYVGSHPDLDCPGLFCHSHGVKTRKTPRELPVVGWREWVALPGLSIGSLKAKIDTGARTSSLHVFDLEKFRRNGRDWVRFSVHPQQRNSRVTVRTEARVDEYRRVRSSSGEATLRPVIVTKVVLLGKEWPIEITLANRDAMGFRMLLGRQAVRRRFWVDPGKSYYGERPRRKKVKKKTAKKKAKRKVPGANPERG